MWTPAALEEVLALAGSEDHAVRMTLRQAVATFRARPHPPHPGGAVAAGFSRDGRWIFSAGEDGEARLIEGPLACATRHLRYFGRPHGDGGQRRWQRRHWSPQGRDGVLQVWDPFRSPADPLWPSRWAGMDRCGHQSRQEADCGDPGVEDGMTPDLLLTPARSASSPAIAGHFGNVASASFDEW